MLYSYEHLDAGLEDSDHTLNASGLRIELWLLQLARLSNTNRGIDLKLEATRQTVVSLGREKTLRSIATEPDIVDCLVNCCDRFFCREENSLTLPQRVF